MRHLHGSKILLLLRNGIATDWESLCVQCGLEADQDGTLQGILRRSLNELREAGLIEFTTEKRDRWWRTIRGEIKVSRQWEDIQNALGISLAEVSKLDSDRSMIVKPYFGLPDKSISSADLFVLMPFKPEMKPLYDDHIVKVADDLNLSVARGDDFFTAHSVMLDVWSAICSAKVIIADCTGRNPNVFYEIGLGHVLGKPVILITQNNEDVPFDVKHMRYIQYSYTPRGMLEFEKRLAETIKTILPIER
ncbi:hypothetical protein [Stenomitos frigidus]|uniref:Nucleoside 2-deoxyribosyltransferase n=1 Tax=Stenomitos frigidus ULC18 TaxID=2107698 RepID=A0A2T1DSU4_9CYAN|nr:hypothetical protein [Stenomitos frigidus]PSB23573.1 hypothetical protein C7B82_30270 [Stenomitos frigidus ULC18]